MKKTVELQGRTVEYVFNPSIRAKRIWLTVRYDGLFVVSAPQTKKFSEVENFILKKSNWILDKIDYYKKFKGVLLTGSSADLAANKRRALELITDRLKFFNQYYEFKFKEIKIRNQKARWGSCSRRGNLSFNYKIIFLPPRLADYLVVHELCHLREFNHSSRFWRLVKKTIPDHREIREEFKKYYLN